jgi:hypothetical protein
LIEEKPSSVGKSVRLDMSKYQWVKDYENRKGRPSGRGPNGRKPKMDSTWPWISTKYDFSLPHQELKQIRVSALGMNLTSAISALKGSWQNYKIAGRNGETRDDIKYRINFIQDSLGLEQSFPELAGQQQEPEEYRLREEEQEWMSGLSIDEVEAKKEEELEARTAIVEEVSQPPTILETEDDWFSSSPSEEEEDDVWSTDETTSAEVDDW